MRVLVAIANFGEGKRQYLDRLLAEYRAMPYRVDVVILSNIPKDLGPDVEVLVGLPTADPWSLPFGHKQLFAQRKEAYDLFIYSEDDILITCRTIDAYLRVTEVLPPDEIAGLMRIERGPDGSIYYPEAHHHFHFVPDSVRRRGPFTLAFFTNEHAAAYLLTRAQLDRAIASGGFLTPPHQGRYDLLVSAATDPYTQCGMKRLLCISHLEDFQVHHLPDKYLEQLGTAAPWVQCQIDALMALEQSGLPRGELLASEPRTPHVRFGKDYYEPVQMRLVEALGPEHQEVLSVGCGWGLTERFLLDQGRRVTAIPLDAIIGQCAAQRGVPLVYGDLESAPRQLESSRFDAVLMSNVLHLLPDPAATVRRFAALLRPGGRLAATVGQVARLPTRWRRWRGQAGYREMGEYERSGVQWVDYAHARGWLKQAGLRVIGWDGTLPDQLRWVRGPGLRRLCRPLATEITLVGEAARPRAHDGRTVYSSAAPVRQPYG